MLFTSLSFILFLGVAVAGFVFLPVAWRWTWLLVASVVFYGSFGPSNLAFLAAIILLAWGAGVWIGASHDLRRRRVALVLALAATLGALVVLKFYDFLAGEIEKLAGADLHLPRLGITAPVGFSFYAFTAAAYLIDVYRGTCTVERHAGRVALYVSWFPKILAGPIERAGPFLEQVLARPRWDSILAATGLQLVLWGLLKKAVIADNLAPIVDDAFRIAPYAAPMELLIAVYFFAFQIYCDFSGYSDIAIGLSMLFGIRLMTNFRRPYLSVTVAEFWSSRWHISLAHWFRDYLYIPMGGSRAGRARHFANIMVVFVASGLWHAGLGYGVGWPFLVWGALNGFYQWVGLATRPFWRWMGAAVPKLAGSAGLRVIRVLITFHLILVSWVFFRADTIGQALTVIRRIWTALPSLPELATRYPFTAGHATGAALILLLIVLEILDERRPLFDRLAAAPVVIRWGAWYTGIFALLLLGNWQVKQFIYMQF